ncbi:MAG: PLP-dependent aminotransferase family protein [Cyanobacteria bacterium HKST-UBA03]|nr:PLP-dependent aminotransferase family protein [Cyanobacteria bacterium HKST-UBA03]
MVPSKPALISLDSHAGKNLPLYEQVVLAVRGLIDNGSLRPNDKAPSIRSLHKQLGVSMATIVQAYSILEAQGVIESRPRSGFYICNQPDFQLREPEKTTPAQISRKVSTHEIVLSMAEIGHTPDIINLGTATLDAELFPIKALRRIMGSVVRHSDALGFYYDMVPGDYKLLKQLAQRSLRWHCRMKADDFVITNGAMESMHLALLAVAKPGDTIAMESPTFYPLLQTIHRLGMYAMEIPTDPRTGMDLDALQTAIKNSQHKHPIKALFTVPNFNNPLGFVMSDDNKQHLVDLATAHDIAIIEDDIYGDLHFDAIRPAPLKAFDKEGVVLHCSSLSKSLCSGLRVGWIAPGRWVEDIKRYKYLMNVSTPTISQLTLAECLRSGLYDRHLAQLRPTLRQTMGQFFEVIAKTFPKGTTVTQPRGGFLLWVVLPENVNVTQLYQETLVHNVSIAPGPIFSAGQEYNNCLRLCCGLPWRDEIEWALSLVGKTATKLAS